MMQGCGAKSCSRALSTGDIDPSQRLIRVRAETTKNMMERIIPYSPAAGVLYAAYLQERRTMSRSRGPLPFGIGPEPGTAD